MGASFEVEAINSKENAFENKYQVVFTDLNSQMFLKYAIFAAFCFACFLSPAGRVVLKNLLPENQPGAEQELLQHVLWIENYSADRTNEANMKHVWNPHLSLGRWKWMYDSCGKRSSKSVHCLYFQANSKDARHISHTGADLRGTAETSWAATTAAAVQSQEVLIWRCRPKLEISNSIWRWLNLVGKLCRIFESWIWVISGRPLSDTALFQKPENDAILGVKASDDANGTTASNAEPSKPGQENSQICSHQVFGKFQAGRCLGYSIGTSWNINLIYTTGFTSNGHRWSNDVEHFAGAMNVAPVDRWSLSNRKIRLSGIGILVVCEDVFPALRKILQCCLIALFARRHGESRPGWWQICSEFSVEPAGSTLVSFQAARPWRIYLQ